MSGFMQSHSFPMYPVEAGIEPPIGTQALCGARATEDTRPHQKGDQICVRCFDEEQRRERQQTIFRIKREKAHQ